MKAKIPSSRSYDKDKKIPITYNIPLASSQSTNINSFVVICYIVSAFILTDLTVSAAEDSSRLTFRSIFLLTTINWIVVILILRNSIARVTGYYFILYSEHKPNKSYGIKIISYVLDCILIVFLLTLLIVLL